MSDGPKFPPGTPEYEAYTAELREELGKFANHEAPYNQEYVHKPQQEARIRKMLGMDAADVEAVINHITESEQSKE